MLAMTSVIVDYTFKNVFLTFYIRQAGPVITYPPTLPLSGPECITNALINALQNQRFDRSKR